MSSSDVFNCVIIGVTYVTVFSNVFIVDIYSSSSSIIILSSVKMSSSMVSGFQLKSGLAPYFSLLPMFRLIRSESKKTTTAVMSSMICSFCFQRADAAETRAFAADSARSEG